MGTSGGRGTRLRRAAVMAAVGVAFLAIGGGRTAGAADPGTSETLTTVVAHNVSVHRGQSATIAYRADDTAGGTVTVDVVVTTPQGDIVRTLVSALEVPVGIGQTWRGRIVLETGRYVVVAHARDASGRSESQAQTASMTVLKALPSRVPSAAARRAAFTWAARRAGRVAIAVVDSRGRLYGYNARAPFVSASVVKAMLLVAYLRDHASVSSAMREVLRRMIDYSDNAAADVVYGQIGSRGLTKLARTVGMKGFHATGAWISTRITAADMALFFRDMETWVPKRHRGFADWLLAHVTTTQRWGIPAAAAPLGYRVYFKPGWLGAWVLANEAARLERRSVRLGLAVFTDGNPSSTYGKETIAGVTARLLRH